MNASSKVSNSQPLREENESVLEIWGGSPLSGQVRVSGAKNSALVLMAGALLCSEDCRLRNVPKLVDIDRMGQVLSALGVKMQKNDDIIDFDARHLQQAEAPYEVVSQLRASFFVIGPLLARMGEARVPLPGGCQIGSRPVELHLKGLKALGAEVSIEGGIAHATARGNGRLKGARIYLDYPSVGATETIMMAATLAEGETILENAAQEPEIVDLADLCRGMGAKITGDGTGTIVISGVNSLHAVDHSVMPDRIEAGTFLIAGAITRSEISLAPIFSDHLAAVIAKLKAIGCQFASDSPQTLRIIPKDLKATDIETLPYPGFPTDMQAQFTALLSICEGNSVVSETVFENRLRHAAELNRMGANIRVKGNHAIITGVPYLSGAPVMATDLRASAALVLAGLAARDKTTVMGLHHLDRGYDNIESKLTQLGAKIKRVAPQDQLELVTR